MTNTENVFDGFALLSDDEESDVDKIFGSGSDEPAPPPPVPAPAEKTASGTLFGVYKCKSAPYQRCLRSKNEVEVKNTAVAL